jgi:hypothetical protein
MSVLLPKGIKNEVTVSLFRKGLLSIPARPPFFSGRPENDRIAK